MRTGSTAPSMPAAPPISRMEARRLRILSAGREVFLEQGYRAASMDLVAATAGVSKTTIYSKFGSKQDLLAAIVDDVAEQIIAMEIVVPETARSTREALTELAVNYAKVLYDPDLLPLVRFAIGEGLQHGVGRTYYEAGPAKARAGLSALFAAMARDGELRITDPDLAADQFVALLQPERFFALLDDDLRPDPGRIERVARAGVEMFLAHYGPGGR